MSITAAKCLRPRWTAAMLFLLLFFGFFKIFVLQVRQQYYYHRQKVPPLNRSRTPCRRLAVGVVIPVVCIECETLAAAVAPAWGRYLPAYIFIISMCIDGLAAALGGTFHKLLCKYSI